MRKEDALNHVSRILDIRLAEGKKIIGFGYKGDEVFIKLKSDDTNHIKKIKEKIKNYETR